MFQILKTIFVNHKKRMLFLLCFLVCGGILLLRLKIDSDMESDLGEIIDLVNENQIEDNTPQHISNMSGRYQVLPNKILFLSGKQNKGKRLFQTDRDGSNVKQLAEDVTFFLEYEGEIYYTIQSDSSLYRYDSVQAKGTCLLEKDVDWFTVYEGKILVIGGESIKTYDLKKGTAEMVAEYLVLGHPFRAERAGDYVIICDNNVHLFSLKEKKDVLLLERQAYSFDDIVVNGNKAYIKMQKYIVKNYDDIFLEDESWNGIWCVDTELYESEKDNMGFSKLTGEQEEEIQKIYQTYKI